MKFSDIPGQESTKAALRNMVDSGEIPHAILLQGSDGTGKYMMARALAQYIHCENRTSDGESCGKCPSCLQHQSLNHIDTIYVFPVVKSSSAKPSISDDYMTEFREFIDESPFMNRELWRSKLDKKDARPTIFVDESAEISRKLRYTSYQSHYKIVLIWQADRMNEEAANKLLKILEEPEEGVIFVLTTDQPNNILPTIYSRTRRLMVKRADDATLARYLSSQYNVDESMAQDIALLAEGDFNRAIELISSGSISKEREKFLELFMKLMRDAYQRKVSELKGWAEKLAGEGRERQLQFYDYCLRMIRENFILNLHNQRLVRLNRDELVFSSKFSPFINERNVLKIVDVLEKARVDIAGNCNSKLVNFDVAVKIILLLKS